MSMVAAYDARMDERERRWKQRPALRQVYRHLFLRMQAACAPGLTLELGGGSGLFKAFAPGTITTDVVLGPRLDLVADAQRLPFADNSFANLVMFDVLHHIECPGHFFAEAARILRPGGRLVMVEPAITPVSWLFYHFIHEEPVDLEADPLAVREPSPARDPFNANQAIPTLLMGKYRPHLAANFPTLSVRRCDWLSLLAYPLSGGFRRWTAIPNALVAPVLWIENLLAPLIGRIAGFRVMIVIEKTAGAVA